MMDMLLNDQPVGTHLTKGCQRLRKELYNRNKNAKGKEARRKNKSAKEDQRGKPVYLVQITGSPAEWRIHEGDARAPAPVAAAPVAAPAGGPIQCLPIFVLLVF